MDILKYTARLIHFPGCNTYLYAKDVKDVLLERKIFIPKELCHNPITIKDISKLERANATPIALYYMDIEKNEDVFTLTDNDDMDDVGLMSNYTKAKPSLFTS